MHESVLHKYADPNMSRNVALRRAANRIRMPGLVLAVSDIWSCLSSPPARSWQATAGDDQIRDESNGAQADQVPIRDQAIYLDRLRLDRLVT